MSAFDDEQALIEALGQGDEKAFHQAIDHYSPVMLRTASAMVGPSLADDIVQESWIAVLRKVDKFQGRSALKTWLIAITANKARSELRRVKRERDRSVQPLAEQDIDDLFDQRGYWKTPVSDWSGEMPEGLLESDELRQCLDKHIDHLPERQREALLLREVGELSHDEICEAMEVSAANARVLLHRARLALFSMVDHFRETGTC